MLTKKKLARWRQRVERAKGALVAVADEIESAGDAELAQRIALAYIDLDDCVTQLEATVEICADLRSKQ